MWAIKVLNGPRAGKIFQLNTGTHTLGRSDQANICIKSSSVSKIHAKFIITEDKVILSDNQSSNGVIVNGVQIQNTVLKAGDKFAIGEVLFDLIQLPDYVSILPEAPSTQALAPAPQQGNNALAVQSFGEIQAVDELKVLSSSVTDAEPTEEKPDLSLHEKVENYIEEVALPGVYEYSSKFDLKYVIMSFVAFFVILVTTLSVIPVLNVSRGFVVDESMRRADSLAKLLVQENRKFIISKNDISVNIRSVGNEFGVDQALIIDALSGQIIAPQRQRGKYAQIPFVQRARKNRNRHAEVLDNKIGVSRPILYTNELTGEPSPAAYAIIIYNMDKAALDIPRTLSLVIQVLLLSLLVGLALYFFLYKVITKPIYDLDKQINQALSEGHNSIELKTSTPIFQKLVSNINSALSRMGVDDNQISVAAGDKSMEATELVQMFPVAAIAISAGEQRIIAHNDLIQGHPLFDDPLLTEKLLDDLTDPSLVENLKDLLQRAIENPNQKHSNPLPSSSGIQFEISLKAIQENGETQYFLISFTEIYDEEGFEE